MAAVVIKVVQPSVITATYGSEALVTLFQRLGERLTGESWAALVATRTNAAGAACLTHPVEREELQVALRRILAESEYLQVGHMLVRIPLEAGVCYLGAPPMDLNTAINNAGLAAQEAQPLCFFNKIGRAHV